MFRSLDYLTITSATVCLTPYYCLKGSDGDTGLPGRDGVPGRDGLPGRRGEDARREDAIPGENGYNGFA